MISFFSKLFFFLTSKIYFKKLLIKNVLLLKFSGKKSLSVFNCLCQFLLLNWISFRWSTLHFTKRSIRPAFAYNVKRLLLVVVSGWVEAGRHYNRRELRLKNLITLLYGSNLIGCDRLTSARSPPNSFGFQRFCPFCLSALREKKKLLSIFSFHDDD